MKVDIPETNIVSFKITRGEGGTFVEWQRRKGVRSTHTYICPVCGKTVPSGYGEKLVLVDEERPDDVPLLSIKACCADCGDTLSKRLLGLFCNLQSIPLSEVRKILFRNDIRYTVVNP